MTAEAQKTHVVRIKVLSGKLGRSTASHASHSQRGSSIG